MSNLHASFLRLVEEKHVCFGHRANEPDSVCNSCVVQEPCEQKRVSLIAAFTLTWKLQRRIGARFEEQRLPSMALCRHCKKQIHPDEGTIIQVEGRGAYHRPCLDAAFPA